MRDINVKEIEIAIKKACILINTEIDPSIKELIKISKENEKSETGIFVLDNILTNFDEASKSKLPICQDTGMVIVFADIGQDVHLTGGDFNESINKGVKQAYIDGFLRKSIVSDPLDRINTNDNTPAIIHTNLIPGDKVNLTITTKGFGSENTSQLKMLKPSDGVEGVLEFVNESVLNALPNACAPIIVGVGIGGDFEQSAINAKRALTLPLNFKHEKELYQNLARSIKETGNNSGFGPMGLGGLTSVLSVNIIESPTHIAGLPVAVNICCYVDRVIKIEI